MGSLNSFWRWTKLKIYFQKNKLCPLRLKLSFFLFSVDNRLAEPAEEAGGSTTVTTGVTSHERIFMVYYFFIKPSVISSFIRLPYIQKALSKSPSFVNLIVSWNLLIWSIKSSGSFFVPAHKKWRCHPKTSSRPICWTWPPSVISKILSPNNPCMKMSA